jgi:4-hydroxy-tetrahydrodipicolinate reductase
MTALKIGLLGYGKMGQAIERVARLQGLEIAWRVGRQERAALGPERLREADVVIEFSRPEAAFDNVMLCLRTGVPVVSGTTGWQNALLEAQLFCDAQRGALLWASNFSVGVNLFFALNRHLARLMDTQPDYRCALTETHHIHKLDAPSGTAITLAQDIAAAHEGYADWALAPAIADTGIIPITALREGEVPGTHDIRWSSAVDSISIRHEAHSREGFAAGAVMAARWLHGKSGCFGMEDVLGLR